LLDYYQVLRNDLQEIESSLEGIVNQLARYQAAEIKVLDIVYPGVRITLREFNPCGKRSG